MSNTLTYVELHKILTLFLVLDVEKPFDQVHWGFLEATLCKFRFVDSILPAIIVLSINPTAKVYISGLLS